MRAALLLATISLAACDSTGVDVSDAHAHAGDVELLGVASTREGAYEVAFRYVGETPSPCYSLSSYGSSYDPTAPGRVDVEVTVANRDGGGCLAVVGRVEVPDLLVTVPGPGRYEVAFERYDDPLVVPIRVEGASVVLD